MMMMMMMMGGEHGGRFGGQEIRLARETTGGQDEQGKELAQTHTHNNRVYAGIFDGKFKTF